MNWISVKDRLPTTSRIVLLAYTARHADVVTVGYMEEGVWYDDYDCSLMLPVTHWMPLPNPPPPVNVVADETSIELGSGIAPAPAATAAGE